MTEIRTHNNVAVSYNTTSTLHPSEQELEIIQEDINVWEKEFVFNHHFVFTPTELTQLTFL